MKLEEIATGKVIAGVVPGKLVSVVAAEMRGLDALELVYRVEGSLGQRRLSRVDEDGLLHVSNPVWLSDRSLKLLAGLVALILAFAVFYAWPRHKTITGGTASNDIPVVIRTNGGMLEVATIKHRRTFPLTEVLFVAGIRVPFCKATASYTVDTYITYRVRLSREWYTPYHNKRLQVRAPRLEPALPVAFDTSKLKATLEKCPMMPSGTEDDLLRSISGKLAKDAWDPRYLQLARNNGARNTVSEFARKWLISQKAYDIPPNTPIDVLFDDE